MTPSTQGFAWEGFFRVLQGDGMAVIGLIIVVTLLYLFCQWIIGTAESRNDIDMEVASKGRKVVRYTALAVVVIIFSGFGWRAFTYAAANRLPRADVDRSAVYDQMNRLSTHSN